MEKLEWPIFKSAEDIDRIDDDKVVTLALRAANALWNIEYSLNALLDAVPQDLKNDVDTIDKARSAAYTCISAGGGPPSKPKFPHPSCGRPAPQDKPAA